MELELDHDTSHNNSQQQHNAYHSNQSIDNVWCPYFPKSQIQNHLRAYYRTFKHNNTM